jgi:hypothetical protein
MEGNLREGKNIMQKTKARAAMALVAGVSLVGLIASSASAADSGWQYYDACFLIDGCGISSDLGSNGAISDDLGCPGDVGQKIEYTVSGVTWISGLAWGTSWIAQYHSNTFAYKVYH